MNDRAHFRYFIFLISFILLSGCRAASSFGTESHEYSQEKRESPSFEKGERRQRGYGYGRNRHFRQPSEGVEHIALLLPLSGKHADAAKAIREGFFCRLL